MKTASIEKSPKTRPERMPIAFIRPISRVRSCTLMSSVLMMPKPAAMSAITAKALRTRMMPSTTVWNVPIWSATVDPVKPAVARSSLMAWISESVASAANLAVALAYSAVAAVGIPVRWASKSAVVSAALVLAPDPTRVGFWIPTIVKTNLAIKDNLTVTLLTAAPYAVGVIAIVLWGRLVDRRGQARKLTAGPMLVGGFALASTAVATSLPWLGYAGLFVCAVAIMASFPGFWTLPSAFLSGAAAAVGIAVVNAIGNLAGFAGPYWVGLLTDLFGEAKWGLVSIGAVMALGAVVVLAMGPARPHQGDSST